MDIFSRVKKFNLPLGQYAVFGSALLDVWGIRKAQDLDIIVTPELFNHLKKEGWKDDGGDGFELLTKGDADVTTIQDRPTVGDYLPDRMQLIKDAVIINEVPFVRIEEVVACKKAYNRPKDWEDIIAIQKYIASRNGRDLYNFQTPHS